MDTANILDKLMSAEIITVLQTALLVNILTLGAAQFLKVGKKVINQSKVPATFDLNKPMTLYNVLVCLGLAVLFTYAGMEQFKFWSWVTGSLAVFLSSFVTWKVGLKELVELIPTALKAVRAKLQRVAEGNGIK